MVRQGSTFPWYRAASELFKRQGGQTVVEIVSQPVAINADDGSIKRSSDSLWCRLAKQVFSIRMDGSNDRKPVPRPGSEDNLTVLGDNPVEFLRTFESPIDLLYLDGWPIGTVGYQDRHLDAYAAARGRFHDRTTILVGDTARDHGGKVSRILPRALDDGFQVLSWGALTLLGRVSPQAIRDILPQMAPPLPSEASYDDAIRLHQEGMTWEAEQIYRGVLRQWPDHAGALHLLGVVRHQLGDHEEALRLIGKSIAKEPGKATLFNNYGAALHALGRNIEALACFQWALHLAPNYVDAMANLGLAQGALGQDEAALATLRRALELQPGHADSVKRTADLLKKQGKESEVLDLYEKAIASSPNPHLFLSLANLHLLSGRPDLALAKVQQAIDLKPDHGEAWFNKGVMCQDMRLLPESRECFDRAVELTPERPLWRLRRETSSPAIFHNQEEIDAYRTEFSDVLDRWLAEPPPRANWNDLVMTDAFPVFNLAYHGRNNRHLKEKCASFCQRYFGDRPEPTGSRMTARRRIGFVVTQRHEGIFLRCMRGILENLDKNDFEVVILCSHASVDTLGKGIRRDDLRFASFAQSLDAAVQRIGEAACDLLYHWEVGSDSLNYLLPFARLAPVQCTSHGSLVTSGVADVQYFLSSDLTEIHTAQSHYTEKLWKSRTLLMNEGRLPAMPPASRETFHLPERGNLYVCFQNPLKLHPDMDPLLNGILEGDPSGTVVLLAGRGGNTANLLRERFARSIPNHCQRIVLLPWLNFQDYCSLLQLANVILDPPHYTAGSSIYDIFSFNQPVVTLPGELAVSRVTSAYYRKMHVDDLTAASPDDYVRKAVRVATDREYRMFLRDRIRVGGEAIFNDLEAVREHERFFREILARPIAS